MSPTADTAPAATGRRVLPSSPVPLLFLIADTGGGHRSAARAVGQALELAYPGRFAPVLCDPLGGPGSFRPLRWITSLYGPSIRLAPWIWGAIYHGFNSRPAMRWLRRAVFPLAARPVAAAVAAHRPAAIVSFHPLTAGAAVSALDGRALDGKALDGKALDGKALDGRALDGKALDGRAGRPPVVTVITDLVTAHLSWRWVQVDRIVVPSAEVSGHCHRGGIAPDRYVEIGLPVTPEFASGPLSARERRSVRRSLGRASQEFLIVVTGGAEGSGGIYRRTAAIVRRVDDVAVVAICGRNRRLHRRLTRLAARSGGRLTVLGFVDNMAEWLRCADLVVTKAGPGTIAEASCCGAPLVLTSHLPGQEEGNTEFVVAAGAGRHAPGVRRLVHEIHGLRRDPAAVQTMRAASARLSRPSAAAEIATLLAELVGAAPPGRG